MKHFDMWNVEGELQHLLFYENFIHRISEDRILVIKI